MRLARGITATTHVDRHRDKLTLGALEDMVRQIEDHYIPVLNQHDPRLPPLGRIASAEVVPMDDGEYALVVTQELFEPGDVPPPVDKRRSVRLRELPSDINIAVDQSFRHEADQEILATLEKSGVTVTQGVKKALEPISVLIIGAGLLVARGFLNRIGDELGGTVCEAVRGLLNRRRGADATFLLVMELRLRDNPQPLSLKVILDSPSDDEVVEFLRDGVKLVQELIPTVLTYADDFCEVTLHYKNQQLRSGHGIRRDGFPIRQLDQFDQIDQHDDFSSE
ncbi:hypothetical protein [Candidatus Palauibacter sp.]|uniref:hypothetical protein n=1 Tax=Candidatus Palauibacter sp. TaxID=3101350 RepID=UPI003B01A048